MSFSEAKERLIDWRAFNRHTRYPSLVDIFVETQIASFTKNSSRNVDSIGVSLRWSTQLTRPLDRHRDVRCRTRRISAVSDRSTGTSCCDIGTSVLDYSQNRGMRVRVDRLTCSAARHSMPWRSRWDERDAYVSVDQLEKHWIGHGIYPTRRRIRYSRERDQRCISLGSGW